SLTGTATTAVNAQGLIGTPNITVGILTASSANFSGNVSIGGTLTYEDVTNIDSVGVITARNGIKVSTGTATTALVVDGDARVTGILTVGTSSLKLDGPNNVVNVGTALTLGHSQGVQFHTQNLHSEGFEVNQINASGIITASSFRGASGGTATFQDIDVDGHTNLDNVSIAGVTTVANTLRYNDNVYASFGTGGDASLYHDGSHLRFNNGTGNFNIQSNDFQITDSSNTTLRFRVDADGATYLRHNGSDRLITSNTGVSFPRDIDVDGHTNLDNVSIAGVTTMTGNLTINSSSTAKAIILPDNKRIYFGDDEDFWIGSNGTNGEVSGSLWLYNHFYLYDNVRLRIGHGQDLELFHNGTDSYIDNNTNNLHIDSAQNIIF
ncbi:MAG: hypothetical protein VXY93_11795, partial [Pseudomonadota bacterium]|nr:hypothetical protein [Pseudomonadota bacterium]